MFKAPRLLGDFRPKLLDAVRGYDRQRLIKDVGAGITVGLVALPLAMAFAIASGLKPEAGLFTAIIAGFLISALGGSRVQIGGPAGAFIVIVYGILERYGLANLIVATVMSGVILFAMGLFKLGSLVRFIPVAVVIGFTNGIAVLIALSQIKDFMGLSVLNMPANFFGMLSTLGSALPSFNSVATLMAMVCLALLILWNFALPRLAPDHRWAKHLIVVPGTVIVLLLSTTTVFTLALPVETIGTRFGGIPSGLPVFAWPEFSLGTAQFLLPPALTLALLGAIESLLCARVADGMIKDRHNPNQELMAQGIANFVTPFFAGMPATGTIARTVTNIKSGASTPIAGIVHALTLLLVVLVAAPLAQHIPLSAMAAILMFVAWNMGEWREFLHLRNYRLPYRITLVSVFVLTIVFDLTVAVQVGLIAACVTFIYRISSLSRSEAIAPHLLMDAAYTQGKPTVAGYRLYGALFFGAVKLVESMRDDLPGQILIVDLKNVIYVDSSGADALMDLAEICHQAHVQLLVAGLSHQPLDIAQRIGLTAAIGEDKLFPDLARCILGAKNRLASSQP